MKNLIGKKYDKLEQIARNSSGRSCSRTVVQGYQQSPNPEDYSSTPFEIDLRGLNAKQRRNNITRVCVSSEYEYGSNFTIGMEVEKSRITREVLRGSELNVFTQLMKGIERDGSCGLEAITNILPLVPSCKWRNKIFNMMTNAEQLIDEQYSQSDEMNSSGSYRCGGHITIASNNHNSSQLLELMRPYIGIIYALNRKRLANQFCCNNVSARITNEGGHINNGTGTKYQPIFQKSGGKLLEFRLWSRFTSVKQMKDRYKMMSEIVDFAVNDRGSHAKLMKRLKPILLSMYNNDNMKVEMIIDLAKHFRRFLILNKINSRVAPFIYLRSRQTVIDNNLITPDARRQVASGEISFARMR